MNFSMSRKLIFFGTILLVIGYVIVSFVGAHAPSSMELDYNLDEQTLDVTIVHTVSNPNTHYVYQIIIEKNGVQDSVVEYESQGSSSRFTYSFDIAAVEGDILTVTANCNLGGSISEETTVQLGGDGDVTPSPEDTTDGQEIPGFEVILIVPALLIVIVLMYKHKKER